MYIVIVGCSEVGYHLTKALLASGHEVVVVEKRAERCQLLSDESGVVTVQGDGTDERVLRKSELPGPMCWWLWPAVMNPTW